LGDVLNNLTFSFINIGIAVDFLHFKLYAALIILGLTIVAAIIPFRKRFTSQIATEFPIGEALAAGVFLGAGLIHLLGESASNMAVPVAAHGDHLHGEAHPYPWPFVICGLSFLFLLFLEHVGTEIRHKNHANPHKQAIITLLTIAILCLHSLFAGAALGIVQNFSSVLILFFAILAHKWAESFALAVQINKSSLGVRARIGYFVLFTLMTPLGIFIGENIPF